MRNVASNESNQKLQNVLFFCAQRYENVESRRAVFKRCGEQTTAVLDDAKKLISTPYREIIADVALARKAAIASHKEQIDSALPIHDAMFENHRLRSILKVRGHLDAWYVCVLLAESPHGPENMYEYNKKVTDACSHD
jgi:hypothetical protein